MNQRTIHYNNVGNRTNMNNLIHQFKRIIILVVILTNLFIIVINAQVGITICACSPKTYEFTFNFNNTCNNNNIIGNGVQKIECSIAPFQNANTTDLIPVIVDSIDILELDSDLVLISQASKFGTFRSNDIFNYTSITADISSNDFDETQIPKALQISILGQNNNGDPLFFAALIIYVTNCTVVPTIMTGSSIGWITLVSTPDFLLNFLILCTL